MRDLLKHLQEESLQSGCLVLDKATQLCRPFCSPYMTEKENMDTGGSGTVADSLHMKSSVTVSVWKLMRSQY